MTVKDSTTLKSYFNLSKVPTPSNYIDLIDTIFDQGAGGGSGDHDHDDRYVQLSLANSILAVHTFAPSSYSPPFILGSKAQGQTVTGFKADTLNKSVTAGAGLSGGGDLTSNVSLSLTLPGTLSVSSTNSSTGNHTHAITSFSNPGAVASLLATDASGYLNLVRLNTDTIADRSGANITLSPAGDIVFDPTGNDLYPNTNYDLNLGLLSKKFLTIHAAELWVETLVAQNTMATIGGRILVGPTTVLTSDISAASTTIVVKHNEMAINDIVYMEADGKVEFMQITSGPTGTGPFSYGVTRNLDGSGANAWYAGDAVFNTGVTDEGFIDLYSLRGVKEATDYGPTIVGNIRTSSTYNAWVEGWAIGNLNGLYGYGATTYGVGLGKYLAGSNHLTIDPTDGIRFYDGLSTLIASWVGTTITLGRTGSGQDNLYLSSGAISIRNNTTERIGLTSAGVLTIKDSGGSAVFTFDSSVGAEFTKPLTIASTGGIYQGSGTFASPTVGLKIWNDSGYGRIGGYSSGTLQWYAGTDGKLYAGGGALFLDSNGIRINYGTSDSNKIKFYNTTLLSVIAEIYSGDDDIGGSVGKMLVLKHNNPTEEDGVEIQAGDGTTFFLSTGVYNLGGGFYVPDTGGIGIYDSSSPPGVDTNPGELAIYDSPTTKAFIADTGGNLRLSGGIYIGSTSQGPFAGTLTTTSHGTIKGGLNIGTESNAVTGDLRMSGSIRSSTVIGCTAYHNASQTVTSGTALYVALNSEWWDTDTIHDTSTNNSRLTCKTAGKYLIIARIRFNYNGYAGTRQVNIYLNAAHSVIAAQHVHAASTTVACNIECSCIYDLAVNDYVEMIAIQDSGYDCDITYSAYWSPVFQMVRLS